MDIFPVSIAHSDMPIIRNSLFDTHNPPTPLYIQPSGSQTLQDCVRTQDDISAYLRALSTGILKRIIPGGEMSNHTYSNSCVSYVINDHSINVQEPVCYYDGWSAGYQPRLHYRYQGDWVNHCTNHTGNGAISFISEMKGCDTASAYYISAEHCHVSTKASNVAQMAISDTDVFIDYPLAYNSGNPPNHPTLGEPWKIHCFKSQIGQPSFAHCHWHYEGELISLYCTFVYDTQIGRAVWKFVRPPETEMLYNKHRLLAENDLPVYVFYHFEDAESYSNDASFVATWAGTPEHIAYTDWASLRGRDVTYVMDGNEFESFTIAEKLKSELQMLGITLKFWGSS